MPADKKPLREFKEDGLPEWFSITSLEQLKCIADDLRLRIVKTLVPQPRTAKQVADMLGLPPTRLYHHFEALESAGLIRLVRQQPKRGTIQRFYRAVARNFRAAPDCLADASQTDAARQALLQLVSTIHSELAATPAETELAVAASGLYTLSKTAAERLTKRLIELVTEISEAESQEADPADPTFRISLLIHPCSPLPDSPNQ